MGHITEKMKEALVKVHGEVPRATEHEARIMMVNTLLGEGFGGLFNYTYDTREEALEKVEILSKLYDVEVKEDKGAGYFYFGTNFNHSLYHGISAKLWYLE